MMNSSLIRVPLLVVLVLITGWLSMNNAEAGDCAYTKEKQVYARPEGNALKMTVFQPKEKSEERRPAIVLIHGGAWIAGTRHMVHWYARRFAEEGFVCATIGYRKLPNYSFPAPVHDAKAAVRWVRQNAEMLHVDPDRIGLFGQSAGGHIAALVATTPDEPLLEGTENPGYRTDVQAAVLFYPPMDLTLYDKWRTWIRVGGASQRILKSFVAEGLKKSDTPMLDASPYYYLSAETPPMMFIHGTRDNMVPYESSVKSVEKLQEVGVPAVMVPVEDRGHGFDHIFPRTRKPLFPQILAFMREHLHVPAPETDEVVATEDPDVDGVAVLAQ